MRLAVLSALLVTALLVSAQEKTPAEQQMEPVRKVKISESEIKGSLIKRMAPKYPPEAQAAGINGTVILAGIIGKDGTVQSLDIKQGHPALVPAALEAIFQWKYKPYLVGGEPVEVETTYTINFRLKPVEGTEAPPETAAKAEPETKDAQPDVAAYLRNAPPDVTPTVRLSEAVAEKMLIKRVYADYPYSARLSRIQGSVVLQAVISTSGTIKSLKVQQGHALLVTAAMEAVKLRRYKPLLVDGKPVEIETVITTTFMLVGG